VSEGEAERGRAAQRRRTRRAIVDAAAALLEQGRTPSVSEVAAAAEVSRRTVYLHFPTHEQLLLDAALEAGRGPVESAFEGVDDVEERVDRLVRSLVRGYTASEHVGRTLVRLTAETPTTVGAPRRGFRRVDWIEAALEPLRDRLDAVRFERLVSSLSLVVGWEAMIVLRDVRALDERAEEETAAWAARSLVRATLAELDS
jgi:AcrR family transcriptional regulator